LMVSALEALGRGSPVEASPGEPKLKVTSVEPRIFGLVPPVFALGLGVVGIALGIALLVSGATVAGIVLLAPGLILLAFAIDSARRWPTSAIARASVSVADAAGSHLGLARVSVGAWSEASREVV
jgi:hypothetical protein